MLFLFTNDDGINSDGLWAMVERARKIPDSRILVVAPDRERSATGHAISVHHPVEVVEITKENGFAVYSSSGTPADCVKLAIQCILDGELPSVVISGINRGPNLGTDVFYSGTVSAALEGALLGCMGIAVSLVGFKDLDYSVAAEYALQLGPKMATSRTYPKLFNINVPATPKEAIAGVAITRLGLHSTCDTFQKRVDPKGNTWFWLSGSMQAGQEVDDTDSSAIARNLISVTPLITDLTDKVGLKMLSPDEMGIAYKEQ